MTFEPELEQFRDMVLRFTRDEIEPHVFDWEERGEFPRDLYFKAAKAGILGAGFPEELGGSGGDALYPLVAAEALLTAGSTGVMVGLQSLGIALPPIMNLGDASQKDRFVRPVLNGKKVAALGVTEPGAGSDVSGIKTRAVRDGSDYIINGSKLYITSGIRADYVTVLARTSDDPHGGLTFFVVEKGMAGYRASKPLKKTGWWASDTAALYFDDVRVPMENRIGDEGTGFVAVMQNFVGERLALAFYGHATAEVALAEAIAYAKSRTAFGKSLSGFQVTRHKLAKMATQVEAAKAFNYSLAHRIRNGEQPVAEVAMAKNFSAQIAIDVCYEAVQIFGGMGYMRESKVERLSRDARLLPIGGGTSEIMNEVISRWHLKL
ncbi:MAG: acyl-CoA dehydrogenase [Myxococcales bacterium]|nr:acyl-CoA dehydrogenase [Myxococcales bacterium]